MIAFVELLTASWLLVLAVIAVVRILYGRGHAALFLTCLHFLFFGLPLWFDLLGNAVEITTYPGFLHALENDQVGLAYCGTVALAPLIWQAVGAPARWTRELSRVRRSISRMEYLLIVLPVLLAPVVLERELLWNYGAVAQDADVRFNEEPDASVGYQVVAFTTLISVATTAGVLARNAPVNVVQGGLMLLVSLGMFWLSGKRHIIAITVVWTGYALWRRSYVTSLKTVQVGAMAIGVVAVALVGYQWYVRGIRVSDAEAYQGMRVDYGRDLVLRQALLPELVEGEPPILEYRGQSFLFYPTLPVPRSVWPDKPWPYAVYQTGRMLGIAPRFIGWGITTSWLDECIANFGCLGILLGPLTLGLICRFGHRVRDAESDAATVILTALLLSVQASAFLPVILVWGFHVLRTRHVAAPRAGLADPYGVLARLRPRLALARSSPSRVVS